MGTPASGVLTNCTGYAFANLTSTPTSISGYGITNALTTSMLGAASGVAPLGSDSKISATYLPSYVDDVIEAANYAALPGTGEASKIYIALDNNKIYRWTGSVYVEIANSVGSSDTAVKLATARTISATGDASWSVSFDGSANATAALTLASVVTAGTGTKVTYNAKGLITGSTTLTVSDITNISTTYQGLNANLTSLAGLSTATTGLIKLTNGTASLDTSSYLVNGGALGTPSSGTLTNCSGYTYANLTGTVPTWNQSTTGTASGLSATLAVGSGGTGATTLAANSVLLGNGTSALQTVAPGVSGNVLVSNGTTWTSSSAATASLPLQTGNSGKYLTTDGTNASWGASTGSGNVVLSTSPTLTTPNLGIPSTLTLTNATGLPISTGVSGLATGIATFLATPTSANLISAVTDETGTGALVFATSPTLVTPLLGTPTSGNFSTGTFTWPTFNQSTTGSAATFTSTTQNSQFNSIGIGNAASTTAGEIRATNNITAYYSDERLKTNIVNIPNALEKVLQLNGVTFNANDLAATFGYTNQTQQVGVIAQQVEAVLPQIVVPAPFDIGVNDDGNEYSVSGENFKTVQYEKLVPLLIEAIKELTIEVNKLKGGK